MTTWIYTCSVAGAIVTLAVMFGGLGLLARRAFGLGVKSADDVALAGWVGWCFAIAFLQVWNLFWPVDGRAMALLCVLSGAGLLWNREAIAIWKPQAWCRHWGFVAIMLLAVLWLANQTTRQALHYDAGLYHLTNIKWAHEYSIVPGLGNLRSLFAYNQSYFLYVAMLDIGPFVHRSHHLASGLVLYLLCARALLSAWRLFVQKLRPEAWRVFDTMLVLPAIACAMGVNGSSPTPDVGAWGISLILASELLRLLGDAEMVKGMVPSWDDGGGERKDEFASSSGSMEVRYRLVVITLLVAVGVAVKLSTAMFGLAAFLMSMAIVHTAWRDSRILNARTWAWLLLISGFVGGVWMIRSVITSGYPIYQSLLFKWPVDWRMPEDVVLRNLRGNMGWGRWYGATNAMPDRIFTEWNGVFKEWGWLGLWVRRMLHSEFTVMMPLMMATIAAPVLRLCCRTPAERLRQPRLSWWFLLVPLASLLYWFLTFPDPRHGEAAFLALGMGSLALTLRRMERTKVLAVLAAINIALFAAAVSPRLFLCPWDKYIGPIKKGNVVPVSTESGLIVYVPSDGERLWDAPLPSTTGSNFVNPKLRLRVPGDLSKGFMVGSSETR